MEFDISIYLNLYKVSAKLNLFKKILTYIFSKSLFYTVNLLCWPQQP